MSEHQFHELSEHTLDDLVDRIEAFVEGLALEDADVSYSQGVLSLNLGPLGTYVLNKQTPNRQIWMSSPVRCEGPASQRAACGVA
jgi:frataxin